MSKINLQAKDWCDLVFEGRNKEYGAYRLRAAAGRRQLRAVTLLVIALVALVVFLFLKSVAEQVLSQNMGDNEQVTELSQLQKEEKKEEKKEKKIEQPQEQPKMQQVEVKNSIQLVVPKIVDDDKIDHSKELKTQNELQKSKFDIGNISFDKGSDKGINIDELKTNQQASNITTPPVQGGGPVETKVVDNSVVDVPASFPGGEAALIRFVSQNTKYPEIALEQGLQGTVTLRFKVDVDGSISQVSVKKGLSRECDKAAMDVVRKLPRFTPAKSNGRPVPVWFNLPVKFQIQ